MKKTLAICNLHDCPHLGQLTKNRQVGTVSFLGRYGIMDFTLSNFSNSGLNKIAILCERGQQSVYKHVGAGNLWINNTKTGSFTFLANENGLLKPKFNTDLANLNYNFSFIRDFNCEYIVVAPVFFLTRVDFSEVIEEHEKNNADITLLYLHTKNGKKEFINCDSISLYSRSKIIKSTKINAGEDKECDISLETYIFKKEVFVKMLQTVSKVSMVYGIRDMVNYFINNKEIKVYGYEHTNAVLPLLSLEDYVQCSFKLLKKSERDKLFSEDWPIYTTTHNTPPSLYGPEAEVKNSFIANGSIIKGSVENCIISRNVIVEKGAVLKNCILFSRTTVGPNTKLEYVLADKDVHIKTVKVLKGSKGEEILYISQGETV